MTAAARFFPKDQDPDRVVFSFCRLLEEELEFRREKGLDDLSLRDYYQNLFTKDGKLLPAGARGYGRRLAPLVKRLQARSAPVRLLDAGCGYGTESLLAAWLGAEVTGVELVRERAELARSRLDFFRSRSSSPLELSFQAANIFGFLDRSKPYDVIWAMEAISHIHPPEDFIALARERLKPGGALILSDPNRLNPFAWLKEIRIRGGLRQSTHTEFSDPDTGRTVAYGRENRFSVFGMKKTLRKLGFGLDEIQVSGFMGGSVLPEAALRRAGTLPVLDAWERLMMRLPGINWLGSLYTIVALRED